MLCFVVLRCGVEGGVVLHSAISCHGLLCCIVLARVALHCVVLCFSLLLVRPEAPPVDLIFAPHPFPPPPFAFVRAGVRESACRILRATACKYAVLASMEGVYGTLCMVRGLE